MPWHSVHVFYHAPDKDDLLLDAVRPLLERIEPHVEAAFVLRHWRRGPHLRFNARCERDVWERAVRPAVDEVLGGYLARHPSTTVLDPAASLDRHRLLAVREQEPGPLTPWPADNSIHEAPYDSRLHVLGSEESVDLLARFYTASTPLLMDMLQHVRAGQACKADLAQCLLLTVAHTAHPIVRSFVSFRVHAEGYLTWAGDPSAARAAFDGSYQARASHLVPLTRAVIAALDDPAAPAVPFVREWAALLAAFRERAGALGLAPPGKPSADILAPQREYGELHRLIFDNPSYYRDVFAKPEFSQYRVLLNYTYLHLTRMGLTPLDRFYVCHATARSVEEAFGVSALELMRRYSEQASRA